MYVESPRRRTNGTSTSTQLVLVRTGGSLATEYNSIESALANASKDPPNITVLKGTTVRGLMQSGRTGPKGQFRNTPYQAEYCNYKSEGFVNLALRKNSTRWIAECYQLAFESTHSSRIGVADTLKDIDPLGGTVTPEAIINLALLQNTKNRAIAECRVKAAQKTFDVAEALVDLDTTVFMVAGRTIQVLRAWRAARKGDWREVARLLGVTESKHPGGRFPRKPRVKKFQDDVASGWLEFQYGWMPLLGSIFDGLNLVNKLLSDQQEDQFSCVRRIETPLVVRPTTTNSARFPRYETHAEARGTVEVKLRFRVVDSYAHFLNSLSLLNPFYVAWVALPFSFVVDWLLPVSTWMEALTATIGLTFVSGYCTTRSWGVQSIAATSANPLYGLPKAGQSGRASARALRAYMRREVFLSAPGFFPYIRFPFSSDTRVASAIALISTSRRMR